MVEMALNAFGLPPIPLALVLLGAFLTAFAVSAAAGGPIISFLAGGKVFEKTEKSPIEDETVRAAAVAKQNIPTMGGLIIGAGLAAGALIWSYPGSVDLHLCMACFVLMGALGMADDYRKLKGADSQDRGLKVRQKLLFQGAAGGGIGLLYLAMMRGGLPELSWPLPGHVFLLSNPFLWVLCSALFVMVMSNSVNVSDGMDGLAGGLSVGALAPLALLAAISGSSGVALFCALLCGATLGFLWYNIYPARVFMGDTGALAIGGSFGLALLLSGYELLMPVLAFVFLAEFASSVIQVLMFKATGRRILPIAPMHHIFQQKQWPEMKTVGRFWIAGFICSLTALTLAAVLVRM